MHSTGATPGLFALASFSTAIVVEVFRLYCLRRELHFRCGMCVGQMYTWCSPGMSRFAEFLSTEDCSLAPKGRCYSRTQHPSKTQQIVLVIIFSFLSPICSMSKSLVQCLGTTACNILFPEGIGAVYPGTDSSFRSSLTNLYLRLGSVHAFIL